MLFIRLLITLLLSISLHSSFGQIFDVEQAPPSIKWRQINTENFQLIFAEEMEKEALLIGNKIDHMISLASKSLDVTPRKISIILQSRLVESNGFVQLAPRRSEFHTTAPQHGDYQNWLDLLAIHELRHIAQMDKLTGNLKAPFFEQLALAIYGVTLPAWFFEGDAVLTETALTDGGRGRLPSWEMPFRTNLLTGRNFSYQKDYMGSFRDITPGFYEMGYFMVEKMERDYGPDFLESLMTRMAKNLIRPYNFSQSLQKVTGYNTRHWHEETVTELEQKWQAQLTLNAPDTYPLFPDKETKMPESWLLPHRLPNGNIVSLYRSGRNVTALVSLDTSGTQTWLTNVGIQTFPNFSYNAGLVVWDELRTHPRYTKQTYSIVNILDLDSRQYRQLTARSRFFSPTLSPTGDLIATVEIDRTNRVSIVLLSTVDGSEIDRFPAPQNVLLRTPKFNENGDKIITVAVSNQGSALVELTPKTGEYAMMSSWDKQQIERPTYHGNNIIFKAHYNGIDNIYYLNRDTGIVSPLTNVAYGAFNPAVDTVNNTLLFNQYQHDGYRISQIALGHTTFQPGFEKRLSQEHPFSLPLSPHDSETTLNQADTTKWASTRYNEVKNLFNFHSLSFSNGSPTDIANFKAGLYWHSDNLLNTMQVRVGYDYDPEIRTHNYGASLSYQRFFPKFSISYRDRGQTGTARLQHMPDTLLALRWREQVTTVRMDIPLVFYRLNQVYTMGFSTSTSYTNRYQLNLPELEGHFVNHIAFPMSYLFYFNRNNRRSQLDLMPRWGQNLSLTYRHLPFDGNRDGTALSFRSTFYFPGIVRNHGLRARFNYQTVSGIYQGLHEIPLVSGFSALDPSRVDNTLLLDYQMPLAYPDWTIGPIAYIKRLKGGFFADFQNIGRGAPFQPRTYGAELRADMNLLRFYLPVFDVGIKLVMANEVAASRRPFITYSIGYNY